MTTVRQYDGDSVIVRWRHCDNKMTTVRQYDNAIVRWRQCDNTMMTVRQYDGDNAIVRWRQCDSTMATIRHCDSAMEKCDITMTTVRQYDGDSAMIVRWRQCDNTMTRVRKRDSLSLGNTYTNKFAVHIPGGERHAREVAETHGYVNIGHIGSLKDHYLFEHPHVHRRSALHSTEHHEKLSSHPHVQWFEQQTHLSRKKRDYLEKPDHAQRSSEHRLRSKRSSYSYPRRDVSQDDLKFNDELYQNMWYFNGGGRDHTDMNVKGAWRKGVTGKNVVITILDDGIERNHEDLVDNYDPYASYDVNGHDPDPMPRYDYSNENRHGTRCAGEVSAKANNTKCIVGVAYDSKIGGVRMLDGDVYDAVEAQSLSHNRSHIDIYSASWGPDDDGRVVDGPGVLAKKAFIEGVTLGRNGKGAIFVWASGNGGRQQDSCSCDGYTNSIFTMSISGVSEHIEKPFYLEECASTLATTFSSGGGGEKKVWAKDPDTNCSVMSNNKDKQARIMAAASHYGSISLGLSPSYGSISLWQHLIMAAASHYGSISLGLSPSYGSISLGLSPSYGSISLGLSPSYGSISLWQHLIMAAASQFSMSVVQARFVTQLWQHLSF
ncbi:hypothetical protein DPMN_111480 [Dreissena polymorpha]|uniref:Uncharacterized protein n=1 Tax=Dreissena polymorpha TaxID=45954 RepID=A0A9D4KEL7_DREPO|nr:hypothetical protein DPMN_111480 [Dreissena polymorpha]